MKQSELLIHTDGGARGNPGPAACAFVAEINGTELFKLSKHLGIKTNNFAEYQGVILALEWINKNKEKFSGQDITFFLDSELVVRQLTGVYKIKNRVLAGLNLQVMGLVRSLERKIVFNHVLRGKNKIADALVNEELDKNH
ncbi:MAG: ribonuclease HI family protein [Candidatus Microgenomates bacterium]|jgi:ribonuclease HI